MEVLFIIVVIIIVAVYFSPFFLESLQASFPYFNTLMRVRYTIIFGGIGLLYGIAGEILDITDIFFGMIAGSLIDFLLRGGQETRSP
ncbi:hypothetical protein ACE1TI_15340 [Alteribacillus sp. JSM 102045]|uniref:hypothetical protein n=1 Tax=Alteribacillus sp. JSM 102045 TaxID=1562101 RepID=UPI0035C17A13